jgi:hypothetical protein
LSFTIDAADPRTLKALEIAAGAGQWLKCRLSDGRKAYGVPSQRTRGRYYLVTCSTCDCEDALRHPGTLCKHSLAVRLHCELVRAEGQRRPPRTRHSRHSEREAPASQPATTTRLAQRYVEIFGTD